jgi:hypothetical protein
MVQSIGPIHPDSREAKCNKSHTIIAPIFLLQSIPNTTLIFQNIPIKQNKDLACTANLHEFLQIAFKILVLYWYEIYCIRKYVLYWYEIYCIEKMVLGLLH